MSHTSHKSRHSRPIALTIAGSDSGGGAGIQADLKTFASLHVHGASAITCVTAQNPCRIRSVQAIQTAVIRAQMQSVWEELPPQAIKTGMLYSATIIKEVAAFLTDLTTPLVVDPVMVATSGAVLLQKNAITQLKKKLLPLAAIITPNLDEAELLTGLKLKSLRDLEAAARQIHESFGCPALVKGGHLRNTPLATDLFFDGKRATLLESPFVRGVSTHGTGCAYSAAITAHLALGKPLLQAVAASKKFISRAISRSYLAAGHPVLRII